MKLFARFFKKRRDPQTSSNRLPLPMPGLRSAQFRGGREELWKQLEGMVERVEKKGIRSLNAQEAQQLPLLYRATLSSLSVARTIALDRNLLLYLENLSLRAYLVVYGPRKGLAECFKEFVQRDFPQAVRALLPHLMIAACVFFFAAFAGYQWVMADITLFDTFVAGGMAGDRGIGSTAAELREKELFPPWEGMGKTFLFFANFLFRHNTLIGIFCFGLGFALGIPTLLLLVLNGVTLGAFIALHAHKGLTVDFIGWLSIHGVTEILAILLCAAAGLVIAEKMIFPGEGTRRENLERYGRRAASVAAGAVGLFFIASILEGGFRQLIANTAGRYAVALVSALFWLLYFGFVGKQGGRS